MALVKYNDRSLRNLTTAPAAATNNPGALVHIKTLTASSSATLSFVDGASSVVLDNTYPVYKFEYITIHPATNDSAFQFQGSIDSGSNYNVAMTTTKFRAYNLENDGGSGLVYQDASDQAQGTSFQNLHGGLGNGSDEQCSGEFFLFNPSSTTFVKHFIHKGVQYQSDNYPQNEFVAGYFNTTSAIDAMQFKMASGNIDAGQIKLYGIKDA
mgnify:CR=1 FL=1